MQLMSPGFLSAYVCAWVLICSLAVLILIRDRRVLASEARRYGAFLCVPWKLALFLAAFLFVAFAGRFSDDETWDFGTGAGMSILTFLTAPWAVGVAYQLIKGRRPLRYALVALALMGFSSSWFYDAYLFWRDGHYTVRWLGNLMLSPFIYVAAGLLFNLEVQDAVRFGEPVSHEFSFRREAWPTRPLNTEFAPLIFAALPFVLIAAFVLVAFVGWKIGI